VAAREGWGDAGFLETQRLVLRQFTMADVDNLVSLDADPEVMRFITGGDSDGPRRDRG